VLTRDNLIKRGWSGVDTCIFYNELETIEHLFVHCTIVRCLWVWIASYNNFSFNCNSIDDLWQINAYIPYKVNNICDILKGVVLWVI
jgi:zinc-binding in reverse transcriptase